jgi:hypothetical protein
MNILPRVSLESLPPSPQRAPAEVNPVRALDPVGGRSAPRGGPQGSQKEQDEAVDRLRQHVEQDQGLSLRGRRAVSAYTAMSRDEERAGMRQALGFEIQI